MGQRNLSLYASSPLKITDSKHYLALQQIFHHKILRCFVMESNYYPLITSNKSGALNSLFEEIPI